MSPHMVLTSVSTPLYWANMALQDEIDLIDSREPAYHRYDQDYVTHVPSGVRHFTYACLILASVFVVSIFVGQVAGVKATSVLPPYFEETELSVCLVVWLVCWSPVCMLFLYLSVHLNLEGPTLDTSLSI